MGIDCSTITTIRQQTVVLRPLFHQGQETIAIEFPKNRDIEIAVRSVKGIKWTQTHKPWYPPLSKEMHTQLRAALQSLATIDEAALKDYLQKRKAVNAAKISVAPTAKNIPNTIPSTKPAASTTAWNLSTENLAALTRFLEQLKLKAYSVSTLKTYRNEFLQLLQLPKKKKVDDLTPDDLRRYFVYCLEKLKLSENTLHSRINAVKFYFEQVLHRENFFGRYRGRRKENNFPNC